MVRKITLGFKRLMPTSPNLTLFAKYYIVKAAKENILIGKP